MVAENVEEDDMPPLIDNPSPTHTFLSGNTPLSFSSASSATQDSSSQPSSSHLSPPASPLTREESMPAPVSMPIRSRPHGKRRDPSYIPRPPNAFILFRCAFVKEQNIPGKVEGNHSKLSKIIGLCWKQLPQEEREKWEAKAVLAQAEHRALYPDWRFRPGANAMAKQKVKDELNSGSTSSVSRRRSVRKTSNEDSQLADDSDNDTPAPLDPKGKGKAKASKRMISLEETRCAKIAGFVAEGIRGEELEVAVKEWEVDHKLPKPNARESKSRNRTKQAQSSSSSHVRSPSGASSSAQAANRAKKNTLKKTSLDTSSSQPSETKSPIALEAVEDPANDGSSVTGSSPEIALKDTLPLTHMFKRSLSVPISDDQHPYFQHPASEPPDSSADEFSPASAGPVTGVWGMESFKDPILHTSSGRTGHSRRETISLPMSSSSSTGVFDSSPHHLTWQEAETRRRLEETQGPELWWPHRSSARDPQAFEFAGRREPVGTAGHPALSMGYDTRQSAGNDFDRGYAEHYGQYDSLQGESRETLWSNLSPADNSHTGLVTVIEDPYLDQCEKDPAGDNNSNTTTPPIEIPTFTPLPLPPGRYYETRVPQFTSPEIPATSFSTLTDWAGTFKHNPSDMSGVWPSGDISTTPSPGSYYHENASLTAPQSEGHMPNYPRLDAEEWGRFEFRAANNLQLPTEPPRFMDDLRRMHGAQ